MQLFALNEKQDLIFVDHAQKHRNYRCIECQCLVRVRGGSHRQNHFYHTDFQRSCRQSEKSMAHIQTQFFLQNLLSPEVCALEFRFAEINRIADVVWFPRKIIFEIQCSPITAEEIKQRNQDYHSLGYQVVWILHDRRYNQWRLTAAEKCLRSHPHYFTDINANGQGIIYDQYDVEERNVRTFTSDPLPIDAGHPKVPEQLKVPHLQHRSWPIHFEGDLFDYCNSPDFDPDKFPLPSIKPPITLFQRMRFYLYMGVVRPYHLLFQILLERACKS